MKKTLLFIPMYNCEKQIPRVLQKIDDEIVSKVSQILIVDNRSADTSINAAIQAITQLKLRNVVIIKNDCNVGLGGSHKTAFLYALEKGFEQVIVYHGDDQADVRDIKPHLANDSYDCILGSRFHKSSILVGYSKFRIWGNLVLNGVLGIFLRQKIEDMGSGLNLYNSKYLLDKHFLRYPNDLTFNVYMLLHAIHTKKKIYFFPLSWREEDQVSNAKVFKQAFKILGLMIEYFLKKDIFHSSRQVANSLYEYKYQIMHE